MLVLWCRIWTLQRCETYCLVIQTMKHAIILTLVGSCRTTIAYIYDKHCLFYILTFLTKLNLISRFNIKALVWILPTWLHIFYWNRREPKQIPRKSNQKQGWWRFRSGGAEGLHLYTSRNTGTNIVQLHHIYCRYSLLFSKIDLYVCIAVCQTMFSCLLNCSFPKTFLFLQHHNGICWILTQTRLNV